jgi:hypothetical protein
VPVATCAESTQLAVVNGYRRLACLTYDDGGGVIMYSPVNVAVKKAPAQPA